MTIDVSFSSSRTLYAGRTPNFDELRARIAGEVITPDDPAYDEARKTQRLTENPTQPTAIVRAARADDVTEAVRFIRRHNLPLAVRSGGHSVAGYSMVDGAVTIDLSGMKNVSIDPKERTACVEAGATSGDLAGPAHAYGLALSTGDTSSVGMGGLTTGGGIGFMARKYGLAIDNLLSAQVVTADGNIVTASPDEHPDLFWAIRGGGGNFGIVTEFKFRLAPVGQILGGALVLPATPAVVRGYLDFMADAPDDLTTIANLMHAPPAPFVPEDRLGELVLFIFVSWSGDPDEGERVLAPLRALAEPVADAVSLIPYPVIYQFTAPQAEPHGFAVRMMFADSISDEAIDNAFDAMSRATSPMSIVQFRGQGGAIARVPSDATAFAHRDQQYFVAVLGLWPDGNDDPAPHNDWTESLWRRIRVEGRGAYSNFLEEEGEARVHDAYPGATYTRLARVKAKYDPTNLFRLNQNIRPQE